MYPIYLAQLDMDLILVRNRNCFLRKRKFLLMFIMTIIKNNNDIRTLQLKEIATTLCYWIKCIYIKCML